MARKAKPWFYRQNAWWMAYVNGSKQKLAEGRGNKKAAERRLLELQLETSKNPATDSPVQTVASTVSARYFANREKSRLHRKPLIEPSCISRCTPSRRWPGASPSR